MFKFLSRKQTPWHFLSSAPWVLEAWGSSISTPGRDTLLCVLAKGWWEELWSRVSGPGSLSGADWSYHLGQLTSFLHSQFPSSIRWGDRWGFSRVWTLREAGAGGWGVTWRTSKSRAHTPNRASAKKHLLITTIETYSRGRTIVHTHRISNSTPGSLLYRKKLLWKEEKLH